MPESRLSVGKPERLIAVNSDASHVISVVADVLAVHADTQCAGSRQRYSDLCRSSASSFAQPTAHAGSCPEMGTPPNSLLGAVNVDRLIC